MSRINLNQNQFSDLINITNNVFFPLVNFVNRDDFLKILKQKKLGNEFFPFPIFFGINKDTFLRNKNSNIINFYYKSRLVAKVEEPIFFSLDKKIFGKKIYGNNYKEHPYYKKFKSENFKFMCFKFKKIYKLRLDKKKFISPSEFIKKKHIKLLPSFHTRNVPHKAHQWIHKTLIKKYNSLLIQPLIGQYKVGEYYDTTIFKLNLLASKLYKNKNVHVLPFFSYPRYGGPREAALHAIVRRNYGCTHFWVGRDHAGYKNFFKKYESQLFCKLNEKKLGIKIISENEPYYCNTKKIVTNKCNCGTNCKINISGTLIRKFLIDNKKIPKIFMSQSISRYLKKKSLII